MATTFDLSGKSILITGAGRGLGRALALGAVQAGARVTAFDIDAPALEELRQSAQSIATHVVDVVDRKAFMAAAERIGRIDAVVNNAMLIRYDPIEAVDDAILDRMLAIGIKGAVWGVQALLRHMDPQLGGVILNLASPVAERGFPRTAIYSMVKGAMGTFTRTLAAELGPRKVRVNALAPGSIPTPGAVAITPQAEYERRAVSIPLRRLGRDEDATNASLFLLSDAASFINGDILHVDGGVLASA
ncbi:MAG TPA: SDR family oxidoreductase [Steroidobacteraceae bacterium]|nr:SDR family oxidoreductase [Steroidobacteraceae bacterium]